MKTTAKSDFPGLVPKAFLGVLKNDIMERNVVCAAEVHMVVEGRQTSIISVHLAR